MVEYVEIRLNGGESVPFATRELDAPVPAGRRWRATTERLQETFEQGVDRVLGMARHVAEQAARSGPGRPEKVTVEIGVNVTTDAGVVVARATTAAHLTVSVEWSVDTNSTDPAGPPPGPQILYAPPPPRSPTPAAARPRDNPRILRDGPAPSSRRTVRRCLRRPLAVRLDRHGHAHRHQHRDHHVVPHRPLLQLAGRGGGFPGRQLASSLARLLP
ncbi:CU044_2847 family protein [Streptomyces chartreusis]|uniref:CU044_2847 family protein n=1 Tax=Streptomyces chartreusis TaxID=1969 RepID=UPI002E186E0D